MIKAEFELWKQIKGLEEDGYEISTWGNVRKKLKSGKYKDIKPYPTANGYLKVDFRRKDENGKRVSDGAYRQRTIHQLVAEAFLGFETGNGSEIDHINFDKTDNHVENLRIVTKSENLKHGSGYKKKVTQVVGVNVFTGEVFYFKSIAEAERETGAQSIRACLNGVYKTSGNYYWYSKEEYEK